VFSAPKTVQATVTLLENLHIILEKTPRDDIRTEVLPMLYNAFESTTIQVQVSTFLFILMCFPFIFALGIGETPGGKSLVISASSVDLFIFK
jgi:SCY1-like protein 2